MNNPIAYQCPLCGEAKIAIEGQRYALALEFAECPSCGLVFIPQRFHLSPAEEMKRYALHENTADNPSYIEYLTNIADDALRFSNGAKSALDFGSGENQVLTEILAGKGIACEAHDPAYGFSVAHGQFDIVFAVEVLEHFRNPAQEIALISRLVKPSGTVYVRTRFCDGITDFSSWWYAKDRTHIRFYAIKTMRRIAAILGKNLVWTNNKDVAVFT